MKYYLTTDNDGHWYIVPITKSIEFANWYTAEEGGDPPEGVRYVNGHPSRVTFENPSIE